MSGIDPSPQPRKATAAAASATAPTGPRSAVRPENDPAEGDRDERKDVVAEARLGHPVDRGGENEEIPVARDREARRRDRQPLARRVQRGPDEADRPEAPGWAPEKKK